MLRWLFGDKITKLQGEYQRVYEKAITQQRNGDIKSYSALIAESEKIAEQIEKLKAEKT